MSRIAIGFFAVALSLARLAGSASAGAYGDVGSYGYSSPNPAVEDGLRTESTGGGG